jgi:hypothetical protein
MIEVRARDWWTASAGVAVFWDWDSEARYQDSSLEFNRQPRFCRSKGSRGEWLDVYQDVRSRL